MNMYPLLTGLVNDSEPQQEFPRFVGFDVERYGRKELLDADDRELSSAQRRFIDIRNKLCLTQKEFCEKLNIGKPRVASYEYGRAEPPEHILTKAEQLLASEWGQARIAHSTMLKLRFSQDMPTLLRKWANHLGVSFDDSYSLSARLGVTQTTIARWKADKARPTDEALKQIEDGIGLSTASTDPDSRPYSW